MSEMNTRDVNKAAEYKAKAKTSNIKAKTITSANSKVVCSHRIHCNQTTVCNAIGVCNIAET